MKKITTIAAAMLAFAVGSASAAVIAYEGFGDATQGVTIDGYTPGTASSGLTGSWTKTGADSILLNRNHAPLMVGISGGYAPTFYGDKEQYVEGTPTWGKVRASVGLTTALNMSVDGTYYMSFFSMMNGLDNVAQFGLTDGTDELMWGRGYGPGPTKGITAYYDVLNTEPSTNGNGTEFANAARSTLFYVAKLVKTNSGTTDNLALSMQIYNLDLSSGVIDSEDPATWLRTVDLVGVNNTFNALQFKTDGQGWVAMDELRLGDTWADVTGIPEPATLGMIIAFGGGLFFIRRNKLML